MGGSIADMIIPSLRGRAASEAIQKLKQVDCHVHLQFASNIDWGRAFPKGENSKRGNGHEKSTLHFWCVDHTIFVNRV